MNGFAPYISSIIQTAKVLDAAGIEWDFWEHSGDSYVDRARNNICSRFLSTSFTDLLFIDSDMSWDPIGLQHILSSPYELTGAAYPCKNNWDIFGEKLLYDSDHAPVQDPITGLLEAQWLPGGFLRMKRSCLEKMSEAYKDDWYHAADCKPKEKLDDDDPCRKVINLFECKVQDGNRYGEDIMFCKKWIAIGGKCYLEPRITFGHSGMKTWTNNFDEHLRKQATQEHINRSFLNIELDRIAQCNNRLESAINSQEVDIFTDSSLDIRTVEYAMPRL